MVVLKSVIIDFDSVVKEKCIKNILNGIITLIFNSASPKLQIGIA